MDYEIDKQAETELDQFFEKILPRLVLIHKAGKLDDLEADRRWHNVMKAWRMANKKSLKVKTKISDVKGIMESVTLLHERNVVG